MTITVYLKRGERVTPTWCFIRRRYKGRTWHVLMQNGDIIDWRKDKRLRRLVEDNVHAYDKRMQRLVLARR